MVSRRKNYALWGEIVTIKEENPNLVVRYNLKPTTEDNGRITINFLKLLISYLLSSFH